MQNVYRGAEMKEASLQIPLLQRLADIFRMQSPLAERLSIALQAVSQDMESESAFLYCLSDDHYLEAFATFDPLLHDTYGARFRMGEGLVGFIAATGKSIICDNMSCHPNFLYSPGVAEQLNLAFIGTPLLSARGIMGVLTIQNRSSHPFAQEKEERLDAIGKFFANLPEFNRFPLLTTVGVTPGEMQTLQGAGLNVGISVGTAIIHHPRTWKEKAFSLHPKEENERLKTAIREMIESIDHLVASTPSLEHNMQEVLSAYRMIAADRGWVRKIHDFIQQGFTAEAAVQKVRRLTRERYAQIGDQTLQNRLSDLEDLASRLLRHLSGQDFVAETLPEAAILVAHNLGPAELLDYDRRFIKGVVLEEGGYTSHVAIVARALDIPIVGRIPFLLTYVNSGDKLIVDGESGKVIIAPNADALQSAREKIVQTKKRHALTAELRNKPCQTLDGTPIQLTLNAGLLTDIHQLEDFQVEGVGLYRTEIPFMMRSSFPDIDAQTEIYRDVVEQAKHYPVTFRILDVGGDKALPYMWRVADENPVLGWRGMRVSLDKPTLLRQQVRALMRASQGKELRLLFPMISDLSEYREARRAVEQERHRAHENNEPLPSSIAYGVMLEVPAIVDQLELLLTEVDFLSIGTNDLFQFFYACDRANPAVSTRYDVLSSSFLNYLRHIRVACERAGVPINICGEMAGKPLEALALLAIGYNSLSMSGSAAGILKKEILNFPLQAAKQFMDTSLTSYSPSLRKNFQTFLEEHQIVL